MPRNGHLSDGDLSPIFNGSGPRVQLSNSAAAAWNSLALHRDTVMRVNGSISAYRTYADQVRLWNLYKAGKGPTAATPGRSNHGVGNAADVPAQTQSSIKKFGEKCDWGKTEAWNEAWHYNYKGGFRRPNPGPDPGNPVLRNGSGGFGQDRFVKIAQERLRLHGHSPGKADGDFGDKTRAAVTEFQRDKRLKAEGIVGRETWRHLRHEPEATDEERKLADELREARTELAAKRGEDPGDVSTPDAVRLDEDTFREMLEECRTELEET